MPLALELASDFYDVATTVAVTLVTRGLSESTMIEASWREIFKRRFPCLAPHFENPSAPRALVQSLLSAKPPQCSPRPLLPDCPTDAAGRALPPRADIVFAAQLSVRGATPLSHRPLLHVSGKPNGNKTLSLSRSSFWVRRTAIGKNYVTFYQLQQVSRWRKMKTGDVTRTPSGE